MKLAISSIAWKPEDDEAVAVVLKECGVDAVEIAPTAYWPDPLGTPRAKRIAKRREWEGRGLPVVAIQSLLFGFPELNIFNPETRGATRERLLGMLDVAEDLGARVLVMGSPRNRARGSLSQAEADAIAVPFFQELGARAEERAVCLCIEPNPPVYGCDFVTTAAEGRALVSRVESTGFGLHLDTGGLALAGENPASEVGKSAPVLQHLHISAPQLRPVGPDTGIDYAAVVRALVHHGYRWNVSVEMRAAPSKWERLQAIRMAMETVRSLVPRQLA